MRLDPGILEASEFLRVITTVCEGNAQHIQDYIRSQPSRVEYKDGISVCVDYLSSLERFFPHALNHPKPDTFTDHAKVDRREHDLAVFYDDIVIEQIILCLDTIAEIADGPNAKNQRVLADGPLLECISKILDAVDLHDTTLFVTVEKERVPAPEFKFEATRTTDHVRVLDKAVFVLHALLEGPPNLAVQQRVLSCIKWNSYARSLKSMHAILEQDAADQPREIRRFSDRAVVKKTNTLFFGSKLLIRIVD